MIPLVLGKPAGLRGGPGAHGQVTCSDSPVYLTVSYTQHHFSMCQDKEKVKMVYFKVYEMNVYSTKSTVLFFISKCLVSTQ